MRLEMVSFEVRDVRFADRTAFAEGVLSINREELRQTLLDGGAFANVAIDVVRPGDAVRIIHVMDAAEPRFKPAPGSTFPGFVGPPKNEWSMTVDHSLLITHHSSLRQERPDE